MRATLTPGEYDASTSGFHAQLGVVSAQGSLVPQKPVCLQMLLKPKVLFYQQVVIRSLLRKGKKKRKKKRKKKVFTKSKVAQGIFELHIKFHRVYSVEHDYFRFNP